MLADAPLGLILGQIPLFLIGHDAPRKFSRALLDFMLLVAFAECVPSRKLRLFSRNVRHGFRVAAPSLVSVGVGFPVKLLTWVFVNRFLVHIVPPIGFLIFFFRSPCGFASCREAPAFLIAQGANACF